MTEREIFEKYNNLSEDELSEKSNKIVYAKNDNMTTVIKRCRGEKKNNNNNKKQKKREAKENTRIQIENNDSRSWDFGMFRTWSQNIIGNIFVNQKILEEYSVKFYKIDPHFDEHYKEKIEADKNGREYILFRIDAYFVEYSLAVETDEKNMLTEILLSRRKDNKH